MKKIISFLSAAALFAALALSAAAKENVTGGEAGGTGVKLDFVASMQESDAAKTMLSGGSLPLIIGLAAVAVILLAVVIIRVKKKK